MASGRLGIMNPGIGGERAWFPVYRELVVKELIVRPGLDIN